MSALRQRVVTASVLIPLVVGAVLYLPSVWFGMLFGVVLLLAAEEWVKLAGLRSLGMHLGFIVAILLGVVAGSWVLLEGTGLLALFGVATGWWAWTGLRLGRVKEVRLVQGPDAATSFAGILVLIPAWTGLVWIHRLEEGPYLVLFLLILIWIADSGAYFTGRRWGRRKLAPVVSPGKTWAGVYGALAGGLLWGCVLAFFYDVSTVQRAGLVLLCLLTVVASIVGDLYESLVKRRRGLKDSGALLPGHGGVLDRIDSLTAAAPVFSLGLFLLGVIG